MLQPKKVKYKKVQKGKNKTIATSQSSSMHFGKYGIKALEPGFISAAQIEMCRVIFTRAIRAGGGAAAKNSLSRRIFPAKPLTKKPAEVRMGKGKGAVDHWVAVVKPGTILFELANLSEEAAKKAIDLAGSKLGIKTRMIIDKTRF